ncbi:hypothetical protein A3J20_05355 [Candidatus Gottesmanbacteria bacterium RIFCSPLOWO2_02_FULL_42_29]|nr:MAG: hypothetical protein A3J20_05355 [Candidatus Gottesmanbacteria bacterium RIFCSPLOWO2_02_FULL_42_29]
MNVALYARVSTGRQENEQTIETQIMAIKDFCKQKGHTIIKEYRDEGWSGTILARPALDELRIDTSSHIWEAVVIYDPDRLARKYSYQELIIDELADKNIPVLFVTTPAPKDDTDKLLYGVKGLFAEYERARIAERFRLGKLRKAREGNVVTSQAPYGYRYIVKTVDKHGYYDIDQFEANIVKMIFDWIGNKKLTIRKLIKELQRLNIHPRKSKRGVWSSGTLSNLLKNETYIGKTYYNRSIAVVPKVPLKMEKYKKVKKSSRTLKPKEEWISIPCPRIIEDGLFYKTKNQLKINFELCERNKKNEYLLADKIRCICGSTRAGEGPQKGKHLYYRCTSRVKNYPLPSKCYERGVNARIADKLVWDKVSTLMSSPHLIKDQAKRYIDQLHDKKADTTVIEALSKQLESIKEEEKRYAKAYGSQLISYSQFESLAKDTRARGIGIEEQLQQLKIEQQKTHFSLPASGDIASFCKKALEVIDNLDFNSKRAIIREIVDKITASQKELQVYGYLPILKEDNVKYISECRDCRVAECG